MQRSSRPRKPISCALAVPAARPNVSVNAGALQPAGMGSYSREEEAGQRRRPRAGEAEKPEFKHFLPLPKPKHLVYIKPTVAVVADVASRNSVGLKVRLVLGRLPLSAFQLLLLWPCTARGWERSEPAGTMGIMKPMHLPAAFLKPPLAFVLACHTSSCHR